MDKLTIGEAQKISGGELPEACTPAALANAVLMGAAAGALNGRTPASAAAGAVFGAALGAAGQATSCANALGGSPGNSGLGVAGAPDGGRASLDTGGTGGYLDSQ